MNESVGRKIKQAHHTTVPSDCVVAVNESVHSYYEHHANSAPKCWFDLQGPLLLTWFNFNPSMDKELHPL